MNSHASAHSVDTLAELSGVSSQTILEYQQQGLIQPDFDDDTLRLLRRAEFLREACEMNVRGVKLLSHLLDEVERLHQELRRRR